jgi:hypothetical protein
MRSAAVLVLAVAALAAPASALAAPEIGAPIPTARIAQDVGSPMGTQTTPTTALQPLNVASDKTALSAYATYLAAVVKGASVGQYNDLTFISTISSSSGCKGALAPLANPDNDINTSDQTTLTALGEEMGDDLSINFDQAAFTPFVKLSTGLSRLHWTRLSGGGLIVKRYVTAETNVLEMAPSMLCSDALLAESESQTVPAATKAFIKSYTKASNVANTALTNLLKLMQTYQVPAEKAVLLKISTLANQITKLTKSDLMTSGLALTSTLEST